MGVSNDSQSLMPLRLRCPVQALIAQPEFVAALLAQIHRVQNSQHEAALEQLRLGMQVGRSEASLRCAMCGTQRTRLLYSGTLVHCIA